MIGPERHLQAAHGELLLDVTAGHGEDPLGLRGLAQIPVGLFRLLEPDAGLRRVPLAAPLSVLHQPLASLQVVEAGVLPADAEQVDVMQLGAVQVGVTDVGLHQAAALDANAVEVGAPQVGAIEVALLQQESLGALSVHQVETGEIGAGQLQPVAQAPLAHIVLQRCGCLRG